MADWQHVTGGPATMKAFVCRTDGLEISVVQNRHTRQWSWFVVRHGEQLALEHGRTTLAQAKRQALAWAKGYTDAAR
jgi:hypothetical protein